MRRTIDQPNDNSADQQITDYNGYDTLNRLTQLTDALNGQTETGYDGQDHLTHVQDPRSNTTAYLTDGLDNLSEENSPDRGLTSHTDHDPAGNLKTGIDARGNTAQYVYDSLNRLLSANYQPAAGSQKPNDAAITLNYRYDGSPNPTNTHAAGQLTHVDDPAGATDWTYDNEGRLHNKTQTTGNVQRSIIYSYDATTGR
ncbi:MAG: hypothetical protein Q7U57_16305, partial [Methylovulum sp.]|nr:hypothetical protein [Methylovulum sp.]